MKNNLAFYIPTYTQDNSTFPKPVNENYEYWGTIINYFLGKTDTIEIYCWNDEMDTIEEMRTFPSNVCEIVKEEKITMFKGEKTSILSNYLLNNNTNSFGEFKWFTVNLNMGKVLVFHSGHWGTEFLIPNPTEKDITVIKSINSVEVIFHQS